MRMYCALLSLPRLRSFRAKNAASSCFVQVVRLHQSSRAMLYDLPIMTNVKDQRQGTTGGEFAKAN